MSLEFGFATPLGKKRIHRSLRLACGKPIGSAGVRAMTSSRGLDGDLASVKLDHQVAAPIAAYRLRKPAGVLKRPDFETRA
jgi:hypothetical protein